MFLKHLISTLQLFTGIIRNKKYQKFELLLCVYLYGTDLFVVIGLATAVYSATTANYKALLLAIVFCTMFSTSFQCNAKYNSTIILRLIDRLEGKIPNFIKRDVNAKSENKTERKFWKWVVIYVFSISWGVVMSPIFNIFSKPQMKYDDPDFQIIPFFYSCIWTSKTLGQYAIWTIFEGVVASTIILFYWSFTIVVIYTATNIQAHAKKMNSLFANALNRSVQMYMDYKAYSMWYNANVHQCSSYVLKSDSDEWRSKYNKTMYAELAKLIEYHQFIDGYVKDFERFMRIPFSSVLAWFIFSNVLFCYSLLLIKGDALFVVKSVAYAIHGTVTLYLFCRVAQIVNELNETLQNSFYCTEWYHLTPELRKYLLTMLLLCQKKYENKGFNMYVVNMNLLLRALRTVYSVLNVLYITENK